MNQKTRVTLGGMLCALVLVSAVVFFTTERQEIKLLSSITGMVSWLTAMYLLKE